MNTDVTEKNESNVIQVDSNAGLFQILERVASNPDADPDKMLKIMDMMERATDRSASQSWNAAMVQAQSKMDPIRKTKKTDKGFYAELSVVAEQVTRVFNAEGLFLSFSQGESPLEGHLRVLADIGHASGHTERRHVDIPIEDKSTGGKKILTDIHAVGSAFSYGRRYLTLMIGNIATPDDDGTGAVSKRLLINDKQKLQLREYFEADGDKAWESAILEWLEVESIEQIESARFDYINREIKKAFDERQKLK